MIGIGGVRDRNEELGADLCYGMLRLGQSKLLTKESRLGGMLVIVAGEWCLVYDRLGSLNKGTKHLASCDPISIVV